MYVKKLEKSEVSKIVGGYREFQSKSGCESRFGKGGCKSLKGGNWTPNNDGPFTK